VANWTRHAVLGLVAREPAHGYALCAEIERWPLSEDLRPGRSTVYRSLERLHAGRMIEPRAMHEIADVGRVERTVYAATPRGLSELDRYLRTRPRSFDELCVRLSVSRREDLPMLIVYAAELEQESLRRFQEWTAGPDAVVLARRGAPWRQVVRALVAKTQAADVASIATVLGDVREQLEVLDRDR
jgi:DNA-binding PadR family transcriptional regulator